MHRVVNIGQVLSALALASAGCGPAPAPLETTDGSIAIANLEAMCAAAEQHAARRPESSAAVVQAIGLHLMEAQFLGRMSALDRALELAESLADRSGDGPEVGLARAQVYATLHRFEEADAELDTVEALYGSSVSTRGQRATILQAAGPSDRVLAMRTALAEARPDLTQSTLLGALHGVRGNRDAADRWFARAQASYRDVSPLAIAWLRVEQAKVSVALGEPDRARDELEDAVARLPGYIRARVLLAEVEEAAGRPGAAIALLEPHATTSEEPEVAGHLARLYEATGDRSRATAARQRAARQFAELMARHPAAFADHEREFRAASPIPEG